MTEMKRSIFEEGEQVSPGLRSLDPASLYCAFEQVKDGRKAKGKRYPLALILTLLMLGKLAGETTIHGIVDWIKERKGVLKQLLNWPKEFPVNSTYSAALAACDGQARAAEEGGAEPGRVPTGAQTKEPLIHTAMDGKTLRGTLGHAKEEQPAVHLLSLYECESGIVLTQEAVKSKENEITAAIAFLHPVLVKGRIISTDAMHTQKKWCAGVDAYDGYYLVIAKENQPGVLQDLIDFFADKALDGGEWEYDRDVHKGHGRLEVREIWTSTQMNEWFEQEWAGIAHIFTIRRSVKKGEQEHEEIVYGFTNLPRKKAGAKRLLLLNQRHWYIEIV
jgi:predicted transposase YbfD/YdcC